LPAKSRIFEPAPDVKVFCFFSSEKKILLLSSEKEAKNINPLFCFSMRARQLLTWPPSFLP